MIRNTNPPQNTLILIPSKHPMNTGTSNTISTSKIKKITANKKNRKEKGSRADPIGSNPHSKGDLFSRSKTTRLPNAQANPITTPEITIEITLHNKTLVIGTREI